MLEKLIQQQLRNFTKVPNRLISEIEKGQRDILKAILKEIQALDTVGGKLKSTEANFAKVASIQKKIKKLVTELYADDIQEFKRSFEAEYKLNNEIYGLLGYTEKDRILRTFEKSRNDVLKNLDDIESVFIKPISDIINRSISLGGNIGLALDDISDFVIGTKELDGKLARHAKTIARDGYSRTIRRQSRLMAIDVGVEKYRWSGTEVEDSRSFCSERKGRVFTVEEIKAWGRGERTDGMKWPKNGKWAGRHPNTNEDTIFELMGGYGCVDNLMPSV